MKQKSPLAYWPGSPAIESVVAAPLELVGALRSCTVSIGVTEFPQNATRPSDLLKNADLAL